MSNPRHEEKFAIDFTAQDAALPQCLLCKWSAPGGICAAFPGGMPDEIRQNRFDHRKPWIDPETGETGDMGIPLERSITFEPDPNVDPQAIRILYRHLDRLPAG